MSTSVWLFKPRSHGRKKEREREKKNEPLFETTAGGTFPALWARDRAARMACARRTSDGKQKAEKEEPNYNKKGYRVAE